jgi:chemotaxis signal transduction protein
MANVQNMYIEDLKELKEEDSIQLVGFKLGDEEYAIDVLKIQEIIRLMEITSVPRMEPYILGVINLRGKVIPVVDLRVRFDLERSDFDKKTRIVVVKFEKEDIGFVVDEVTEVIRIDKSIVEPTPPLVGAVGQEYILGICKYQDRLIILLDIDRVVYSDDEITSDLRKKFTQGGSSSTILEKDVEESAEVEEDIELEEKSEKIYKEEEADFSKEGLEKSKRGELEEESQEDLTDDIDRLIELELAKREKETEELLKKKKEEEKNHSETEENMEEDLSNILNDALNQANSVISPEAKHVEQEDLDRLIAEELAKREKETEELLKKKKEREKKKIDEDEKGLKEDIENSATFQVGKLDKSDNIVIERDSLKELKELAKKIINGETKDIDVNIKGEIGELLKLLIDTKNKVDSVEPSVVESNKDVPYVAKTLESVNDFTEKAALNLMEAADNMSNFFADLNEEIGKVEKALKTNDLDDFNRLIKQFEDKLQKAEDLGFQILQALEFQDINEQKSRKIIKKVEEIGARLGTILGYAKLQNLNSGESNQASQEDIDKLLGEFGLS